MVSHLPCCMLSQGIFVFCCDQAQEQSNLKEQVCVSVHGLREFSAPWQESLVVVPSGSHHGGREKGQEKPRISSAQSHKLRAVTSPDDPYSNFLLLPKRLSLGEPIKELC